MAIVPLNIQSSGPRLVRTVESIEPPPKAAPREPSECWISIKAPNRTASIIWI